MLFRRHRESAGDSVPASIGGGTKPVREATVALLRRYRGEIGYGIPVTEDDLPRIRDWFMDREIEHSQDDAEGLLDGPGRAFLVGVSDAFDDFHPLCEADCIDLDDLNRRLEAAAPVPDRRSVYGLHMPSDPRCGSSSPSCRRSSPP